MWTPSQRYALLILGLILMVFLVIELDRKPVMIDDPPGNHSPRADEILDRLDPNTADTAALAAIPNLGEKRAAEIVNYREDFIRKHPHTLPFKSVEDLLVLKGFGPATEANLTGYLMFGNRLPK